MCVYSGLVEKESGGKVSWCLRRYTSSEVVGDLSGLFESDNGDFFIVIREKLEGEARCISFPFELATVTIG